ncbi:DNA-3-methyladenine glycosylase 2 family protein [Methylobacterium organophilum]|uniref:DNA-3-methyladenine glycosylase family protein n=1 Tax=Methylobacterium organophilum TaxID=410 RepID=UPI001F137614|nr:AlkA N-terminal domain-containing protein [Methylobacterium organophilum]UMY18804.1 DNA-3-methyladenine glycosylase 2 family protein [Methylobacterium organophilum]
MQPDATAVLRLPFKAPFDWDGLHAYLSARAIPGVEVVRPGLYTRTVASGETHGVVRVERAGDDALALTIVGPFHDAADRAGRLFDLDADPEEIGTALSADPFMAGLVAARPGMRVPGAWDGFELAVRAILGQQVSVAAATRLAGRLVAVFGTPLASEVELTEAGLTHVFPSPAALVDADVSLALNIPRARGAAVRAVAAAVLAEPDLFDPGQGLAAATTRLKALRGIGDWTAHYVAMRALRESDALPTGDIGLLRALEDEAGRPTAKTLEARSMAWRPWRSYAVLHLWAHDAARSEPSPSRPPKTRRTTKTIPEQGAGCGPREARTKVSP